MPRARWAPNGEGEHSRLPIDLRCPSAARRGRAEDLASEVPRAISTEEDIVWEDLTVAVTCAGLVAALVLMLAGLRAVIVNARL